MRIDFAVRTYFQHSLLCKHNVSCFASKQNDEKILAVRQSYHNRYYIHEQVSCNTNIL